jgi:hypothetical protein
VGQEGGGEAPDEQQRQGQRLRPGAGPPHRALPNPFWHHHSRIDVMRPCPRRHLEGSNPQKQPNGSFLHLLTDPATEGSKGMVIERIVCAAC